MSSPLLGECIAPVQHLQRFRGADSFDFGGRAVIVAGEGCLERDLRDFGEIFGMADDEADS